MRRSLRARLDRRVARAGQADASAREQRCRWRAQATMGELIRFYFARVGIDPVEAPALRIADEAVAALAALPDTEELQRADGQGPRDDDEQRWREGTWLAPKLRELVEQFDSGKFRDPVLMFASLPVLLAWCIARVGVAALDDEGEMGGVCC